MEWSADICYNMNKLWKHYAKWKELDTKGHMWFHLYDMSQVGNCTEIDPGAGGWGGKESWLLMGMGLLSGDE